MITHSIQPIYNEESKILILGTFPSIKSREAQFFYGHPQNRFWRLLANLLQEPDPESVEEKRNLILTHNIALWDVIATCNVVGSSDASITDVVVNDVPSLIEKVDIKHIYLNGNKAYELFHKNFKNDITIPYTKLPSTSPANASYQMERLVESWKEILTHLK